MAMRVRRIAMQAAPLFGQKSGKSPILRAISLQDISFIYYRAWHVPPIYLEPQDKEKNMRISEKSDEMARILTIYLEVNSMGRDWLKDLKEVLQHPNFPKRDADFKNELAHAILYHHISLQEYEELTNQDFDTEQELENWLRELWEMLYPGQAIQLV